MKEAMGNVFMSFDKQYWKNCKKINNVSTFDMLVRKLADSYDWFISSVCVDIKRDVMKKKKD